MKKYDKQDWIADLDYIIKTWPESHPQEQVAVELGMSLSGWKKLKGSFLKAQKKRKDMPNPIRNTRSMIHEMAARMRKSRSE